MRGFLVCNLVGSGASRQRISGTGAVVFKCVLGPRASSTVQEALGELPPLPVNLLMQEAMSSEGKRTTAKLMERFADIKNHVERHLGFPGGSDGKDSACNVRDSGSIPGLVGSPGEGNGNTLQYSCLENSMDRGVWWTIVHGDSKSQTQLSD